MADLTIHFANCSASVYVGEPGTYSANVAVQGTVDISHPSVPGIADTPAYGTSVFVERAKSFYRRRLLSEIVVSDRLPNQYYGITEVDDVQIQLENLDGAFNGLIGPQYAGAPVRARRYDQLSGELLASYVGIVSEVSIGDELAIHALSHNLDVLSTELPRNKVTAAEFPTALDTGASIAIPFGRARRVSCPYVTADELAQTFDYLVCEEIVEIEDVYKDGYASFTTDSMNILLFTTIEDQPFVLVGTTVERSPEDFYQRLFVRFNNGPLRFREYEVVKSTSALGFSTPHPWLFLKSGTGLGEMNADDWNAMIADEGDPLTPPITFRVQEYLTLPGNVYRGRTALRFRFKQSVSGQLRQISADVIRYGRRKKNWINRSDQPGLDAPWVYSFDGGATPDIAPEVLTPTVKNDYAPDLVSSPVRMTLHNDDYLRFTRDTPIGASDRWTFSIFAKLPLGSSQAVDLKLILTSNGSGVTPTSEVVALNASTWTRVAVTKNALWGTGATTLTAQVENDAVSGAGVAVPVLLCDAQLEQRTLSYYESISATGKSQLWSFPDAIADILSNTRWGLGQSVNLAAIEAANEAISEGTLQLNATVGADGATPITDYLFLKCHGSLPDMFGAGGTAQDILDEMLQVRGMRIVTQGGAWRLICDAPGMEPDITLGTVETPWRNVGTIGPISQRGLGDSISRLRVLYQPVVVKRTEGLNTVYAYELASPVMAVGISKDLSLRWVRDHGTADHVLQYLRYREILLNQSMPCDTGNAARAAVSGDLVRLFAPRLQPENVLPYTDGDPDDPQPAAPLGGTSGAGRNPLGTLNDAYRLVMASTVPAALHSGLCRFTGEGSKQRTIATIWLRAAAPVSGLKLQLASPASAPTTTIQLDVTVGTRWKKWRIAGDLAVDPGGFTFGVYQPAGHGGGTIQYWGAQVTFDYDRAYTYPRGDVGLFYKTTTRPGAPTRAQTVWQIAQVERTTISDNALVITPFNDAVFRYYFAMFPTWPALRDEAVDVTPDSGVPPLATGLTLPPNPPAATSAAGVEVSGSTSNSWARISFLMPQRDAAGVRVQIRRQSEVGWTDVATVYVAEHGLGTAVSVVANGLLSGMTYEVRLLTFTQGGQVGGIDTFGTFRAR
jgi:hypothetical protein